ncbi:fibronectin type III domain-containing protein [Xanthomonas sp. NCPPB 1068]|uniref:fibronectin type III domain-containing protein n=1 Tax=Xanthomonas sp. NCPPB 1068 TaxID=487525 RepID=UPI00355680B3
MSAPAQFHEVRYRIIGAEPTEWVVQVVAASSDVTLDGLTRGAQYEIQIRAVARNGRKSNWVNVTSTVATTNREGAAALPTNAVANQASMWGLATSVTYAASTTAEGVATATISASAGSLVIGSKTINYGPSSATVSGAAGQVVKYYLYYDDPQLTGGSKVMGLASNIVDSANVDGRIALAPITVTFPAAGQSGSGGGSIGGGGGSGGAGSCPSVNAWVIERARGVIRAHEVQVGDFLRGVGDAWVRVTYSQRKQAEGVCITSEIGRHQLTCSMDAPILVCNGDFIPAEDLRGKLVMIDGSGADEILNVEALGHIEVQHISCAGEWSDRVFLVGDDQKYLFPHHNAKQAL